MKKTNQHFREAIERANKVIDEAVDAARAAGVSERYVADALRKSLRHRAKYLPKPAGNFADFIRRHSKPTPRQAIDADTLIRRQQDEQRKEAERQAEYELSLQMIDAGYKAMAMKLHPDKGGSKDAMHRLNNGRDRLKANA